MNDTDVFAERTRTCDACARNCDGAYVETRDARTHALRRTLCNRCDTDARFGDYIATGRITTRLTTEVAIRGVHLERNRPGDIVAVYRPELVRAIARTLDGIKAQVKAFERDVWFGDLQDFVRGQRVHGGRAQRPIASGLGEIAMLTYAMAGRAMITLEAPGCSVTLITDEASARSCMGLQGIDATEAQALGLLEATRAAWQRGLVLMVDDTKIRMF